MTLFRTIPTISLPFATGNIDITNGASITSTSDGYNGLSPLLGAPNKDAVLTRHHLNMIGFYSTIGIFLHQSGYQPGFNHMPEGGWPKGAILTDFTNGVVQEFVNTEENNQAKPEGLGETVIQEMSNGWQPLWKFEQFNFFPDFSSKTVLWENKQTKFTEATDFITQIEPGWYEVSMSAEYTDKNFLISMQNPVWFGVEVYMGTERYIVRDNNLTPLYTLPITQNPVTSRLFPGDGYIRIVVPEDKDQVINQKVKLTVTLAKYEMKNTFQENVEQNAETTRL